MVKNCLLEMTLFGAAKETDNKLRWDADVEGTNFALYIPKWRVPSPWPSRIWVNIFPRRVEGDDPANLSSADIEGDPSLKHEPIIATVSRFDEKTQTVRFRPVGDPKSWEIGEPYVPRALIRNGEERLRVVVMWDATSRGSFHQSAPIAA